MIIDTIVLSWMSSSKELTNMDNNGGKDRVSEKMPIFNTTSIIPDLNIGGMIFHLHSVVDILPGLDSMSMSNSNGRQISDDTPKLAIMSYKKALNLISEVKNWRHKMYVIGRWCDEEGRDVYLAKDSVSWTVSKTKIQFFKEFKDAKRWLCLHPFTMIYFASRLELGE